MFFEFGLKDFIDILLVALMLYYIYRLMRESRSLNVFIGILVFVVIWIFVSQVLEMTAGTMATIARRHSV